MPVECKPSWQDINVKPSIINKNNQQRVLNRI